MPYTKYLLTALALTYLYMVVRNIVLINETFNFEWDNVIISVNRSKIFDIYLKKFNKSYNEDEYQVRLTYFRESMKDISFLNGVTGARHGWTQFTDMSKEEISKLMLKSRRVQDCTPEHEICVPKVNETIIPDDKPNYVDWRKEKHAIGPVLHQLKCACCWAISIVGNMEAMAAIRDLGYQQLSVQELIDCSTFNKHCSGGSMSALEFLCVKKFGLTTEEKYPLKLVDGNCASYLYHGVRWLKEYWVQCNMNEDEIQRIIAHYGPVVVVVNALPWISYTDGVIQYNCHHDGNSLDHMVQIVGYDLTASIPHYIVKNSWGSEFGEDGYVRLAVNKNTCGLADEVAHFDVY